MCTHVCIPLDVKLSCSVHYTFQMPQECIIRIHNYYVKWRKRPRTCSFHVSNPCDHLWCTYTLIALYLTCVQWPQGLSHGCGGIWKRRVEVIIRLHEWISDSNYYAGIHNYGARVYIMKLVDTPSCITAGDLATCWTKGKDYSARARAKSSLTWPGLSPCLSSCTYIACTWCEHACTRGTYYIPTGNIIGSLSWLPLGTTAVVSGARMLMCIGPARPELPPHVKEGRNEAVGRPNQRSTPQRNPRSQPGARRREERGWFFALHSSRHTAVTVAVEVWNALDSFPLLQSWLFMIWLLSSERPVCIVVESRLCKG